MINYFVKKAGKREWGLWLGACLFLSFGFIVFLIFCIYSLQSNKFLEYPIFIKLVIYLIPIIYFLSFIKYIYIVNIKHKLLSSKYIISENECTQLIKDNKWHEGRWDHLTKIKGSQNQFVKLHFTDGATIVMFWGLFQDSIKEMETINDNLKEKYDAFMMPFTRKSESKTLLIILIIFALLSIVLAFLTPTIANFIKNIE